MSFKKKQAKQQCVCVFSLHFYDACSDEEIFSRISQIIFIIVRSHKTCHLLGIDFKFFFFTFFTTTSAIMMVAVCAVFDAFHLSDRLDGKKTDKI